MFNIKKFAKIKQSQDVANLCGNLKGGTGSLWFFVSKAPARSSYPSQVKSRGKGITMNRRSLKLDYS